MFNAYWEPLTFEVPPRPTGGDYGWRRVVDTALASPDDFAPWDSAPAVTQASYVVHPRSMAVLILALQPRYPTLQSRR
jgi:glycogen operon protein